MLSIGLKVIRTVFLNYIFVKMKEIHRTQYSEFKF